MDRIVSQQKRDLARALRVNATDAERRLWHILRAHRLGGFKFRRQVPIDDYFASFVCLRVRLIVEAAGEQRPASEGDMARDLHFAAQGFTTLRFEDWYVISAPDAVATEILRVAEEKSR